MLREVFGWIMIFWFGIFLMVAVNGFFGDPARSRIGSKIEEILTHIAFAPFYPFFIVGDWIKKRRMRHH